MNRYKDLDLRKFEGLGVEIELKHFYKDKTGQYVNFEIGGVHFSGWFDKVYGEEGETIVKTVKEMFLVQHNNGGRKFKWKAKSYKEYFNDKVKKKYLQREL